MGNTHSKRKFKKAAKKYVEERKTFKEETQIFEEEANIPDEQIHYDKNLEQTNKEETKESEETKAEEVNETDQKKMTSVELNEQSFNIVSLFNCCEEIDMIMEVHGGYKVLEFIKQMTSSSLIQILKGKEYKIFTERMLNSNKIINKIQNFLENLKCWAKDCPHKAVLIYADESINQIYCRAHGDVIKHSTEEIIFENEFNNWKPALHALEKKLLFLQVKMIIIRDQSKEENLYGNVLEDLESKFEDIKNMIKTMKKKIKSSTTLLNSDDKANGKKSSKYRSLSFIQDDSEKCSKLIHEMLLLIYDASLGRQIELLIYVLHNASRDIEFDEESKFNSYPEVPDEIYEKAYKMIDISLQSKHLMEGFMKKIKKSFKYDEKNQKVKLNW